MILLCPLCSTSLSGARGGMAIILSIDLAVAMCLYIHRTYAYMFISASMCFSKLVYALYLPGHNVCLWKRCDHL